MSPERSEGTMPSEIDRALETVRAAFEKNEAKRHAAALSTIESALRETRARVRDLEHLLMQDGVPAEFLSTDEELRAALRETREHADGLRRAQKVFHIAADADKATITELRGDNERLREVLREIAALHNAKDWQDWPEGQGGPCVWWDEHQDIAKLALHPDTTKEARTVQHFHDGRPCYITITEHTKEPTDG